MNLRYIARLDTPNVYRSFGYVEPGGLGTFDPVTYVEVGPESPNYDYNFPNGWASE